MKQILTANDVGEALGVSASRIHQMIRAGLMPAVRIGTRGVRIPRQAFENYLSQQNTLAESNLRPEAMTPNK